MTPRNLHLFNKKNTNGKRALDDKQLLRFINM